MTEWTKLGNWNVNLERESFRIFPKAPDGKTIPVLIKRVYLTLRREFANGVQSEIRFKHFLHQRKLHWNDSRQKGSCGRTHIKTELARLLFQGDLRAAELWMVKAENLL